MPPKNGACWKARSLAPKLRRIGQKIVWRIAWPFAKFPICRGSCKTREPEKFGGRNCSRGQVKRTLQEDRSKRSLRRRHCVSNSSMSIVAEAIFFLNLNTSDQKSQERDPPRSSSSAELISKGSRWQRCSFDRQVHRFPGRGVAAAAKTTEKININKL